MATKSVRVVLEAIVSGYQAKMAQATASTRMFSAGLMKASATNREGFTTLGLGAVALGGAMLGAFAVATKAAIEFEESFAGVRKTVDATETEFGIMADSLREMATEIPVNVNELNRIAEAAGQLGIEKDAILGFTRTMADMGVATNLSSDQAAEALARLANIMQTPADAFDRLGSVVVDLGNKGAATEAEIVEMGHRIAGAGNIIGLTEAEVLSFAEALASVGIDAQAGGSAISRVFIKIAGEVESGGEKLETFAQVAGMSGEQFAQAFQTDAAGALVSFIEGLGRLEAQGGNTFGVLQELGLTEIRVRDAMLRASGAGDLFRTSLANGSKAWRENIALTEEAEKRYGTTASKIQVAKNQINEAAIAFGEGMLPAVGAVAGVIGDLAEGVSNLPAPLRALATGAAGVGGAMLLLAGAALLVVPRLAAAKAAMLTMAGTTSLVGGSLSKVAGFLMGPWGMALTVATIAITQFGKSKQEAAARVDAFRAAIEADSGALGEHSRRSIAAALEQEGLLEQFEEAGAKLPDVIDAVMGEAEALDRVLGQLGGRMSLTGEGGIRPLRNELLFLKEDFVEAADSAGRVDAATGQAAGSANEATSDFAGLGTELEETKTAADLLTEALDTLSGAQIDTEEAAIAGRSALRDLRASFKEGKGALTGHQKAADENRQALIDAVEAAKAHGAAITNETGSVEAGSKAIREYVRDIIDTAVQAGASEREVKAYLRRLGMTPKEVKTTLRALVNNAQQDIDRFVRNNDGRVIGIRIEGRFHGGGGRQLLHGGGVVGESSPRRLHVGGTTRGDEELVIGQRGERMLSQRQNRAYEDLLGARPTAPAVHVPRQAAPAFPSRVRIRIEDWEKGVGTMMLDLYATEHEADLAYER